MIMIEILMMIEVIIIEIMITVMLTPRLPVFDDGDGNDDNDDDNQVQSGRRPPSEITAPNKPRVFCQ